jgi:hypothetical protein
MTLLECERAARQATGTPSSISWRSVGEMVQISVEVSNDSSEQTVPDTLVIEAAAFGAFIPTVPIARIAVDALDPGERREITTTVSRTLLDSTTQDASSEAARDRITEIFNSFVQASAGSQWIGNLNVYFDRASDKAVERHCAFDLKVPTGTTIVAAFLVRDDGCTFRTRCSDDAWSVEVLAIGSSVRAAQLFVRTPGDPGKTARVTVDVTRTFDGKVVPVEFEFETVSGCGETLGCIDV